MSTDQPGLSAHHRIDTTTAHPARRYNYWLGGKDNFAADRASGDAIEAALPSIRLMAVENRMFLGRTVRYLAEQGVAQFLDIGTGIPAPGNTHEIAQSIIPTARTVYVDNDPIVLTHARALLTSASTGTNAYLDADLREPDTILGNPDLHDTLVRKLIGALPSGSYVVASHSTWEYQTPEAIADLTASNQDGRFTARAGEQLAALFDGLELVEPGLVSVSRWRADDAPQPRPRIEDVSCNGLVARIP
jgi:hypothetical protein